MCLLGVPYSEDHTLLKAFEASKDLTSALGGTTLKLQPGQKLRPHNVLMFVMSNISDISFSYRDTCWKSVKDTIASSRMAHTGRR